MTTSRARSARDVLAPFCPAYTHAMEIIGRRWTGAIIRSMLVGATRYSEIVAAVPGLSDRLLSERLKELEHEGIVERRVTPSTPVRVDYSLTEKGRALASVVREVADWAERWGEPVTKAEKGGRAG
jgi:DNA-binding HxlR family transcriptional regulator